MEAVCIWSSFTDVRFNPSEETRVMKARFRLNDGTIEERTVTNPRVDDYYFAGKTYVLPT